jgi:hypothetical protein
MGNQTDLPVGHWRSGATVCARVSWLLGGGSVAVAMSVDHEGRAGSSHEEGRVGTQRTRISKYKGTELVTCADAQDTGSSVTSSVVRLT